MARRRGFFAELQHQAAVAERDRQRAHAAAVREAQKQQREATQARATAERARVTAARADARSNDIQEVFDAARAGHLSRAPRGANLLTRTPRLGSVSRCEANPRQIRPRRRRARLSR